jgi:hypothetical protein
MLRTENHRMMKLYDLPREAIATGEEDQKVAGDEPEKS